MERLDVLSLPALDSIFTGLAAAIGFAGTLLAHVAYIVADRTGTRAIPAGTVFAVVIFVGAGTSLPDGPANIGWESAGILALEFMSAVVLFA